MLPTLTVTLALLSGSLSAIHPCLPFDLLRNPPTGSDPPAMRSDEQSSSSRDATDARAEAPVAVSPAPLPPPPIIHRVPPPLAASEQARYQLTYGVLSVGEATVAIDGEETVRDQATLHVRGQASGSFAGFGKFDKTVDVGFDPIALAPRPRLQTLRWFRRLPPLAPPSGPLPLDPVSLLLRLRAAPPAPGALLVATVSDGNGRWQVTLANGGVTTLGTERAPALKIDGRAAPVGGGPKDARVAHDFTVWLAADPTHLPLRLEMPLGVADLTVSLVEVRRTSAPRAAK